MFFCSGNIHTCTLGSGCVAAMYVCVIVAYVNVSIRLSKLDLLLCVHLLFGTARGVITLDQVQCTGDGFELAECRHGAWGVHDCTYQNDAVVSCTSE